jgi:hypothetical protein
MSFMISMPITSGLQQQQRVGNGEPQERLQRQGRQDKSVLHETQAIPLAQLLLLLQALVIS